MPRIRIGPALPNRKSLDAEIARLRRARVRMGGQADMVGAIGTSHCK